MTALLTELNTKFNAGLNLNFSTSRENPTLTEEEGHPSPTLDNIILVSSSHLTRTATALKKLGEHVNSLASPQ